MRAAILVAASLACAGSGSGGSAEISAGTGCTFNATIEGAVNGGSACTTPAQVEFVHDGARSTFLASAGKDGLFLRVAINFDGQERTGVFSSGDPGALGSISAVLHDENPDLRAQWDAVGPGFPNPRGSYLLHITDPGRCVPYPDYGADLWVAPHGTLAAVLVADGDTAATGSLTVNARF